MSKTHSITNYGNTPGPARLVLGYCFFLALLLSLPGASQAQKPEKELIRRSHPEGTMFFIRPQDCTTSDKGKAVADFTLDQRDSATGAFAIAFTLITQDPIRNVDSSHLYLGTQRLASSLISERYFVEPKGKKWTNRYAIRFTPYEGIHWLIDEGTPTFTVFYGGRELTFSMGSGEQFILRTLGQVMAIETGLDQPQD